MCRVTQRPVPQQPRALNTAKLVVVAVEEPPASSSPIRSPDPQRFPHLAALIDGSSKFSQSSPVTLTTEEYGSWSSDSDDDDTPSVVQLQSQTSSISDVSYDSYDSDRESDFHPNCLVRHVQYGEWQAAADRLRDCPTEAMRSPSRSALYCACRQEACPLSLIAELARTAPEQICGVGQNALQSVLDLVVGRAREHVLEILLPLIEAQELHQALPTLTKIAWENLLTGVIASRSIRAATAGELFVKIDGRTNHAAGTFARKWRIFSRLYQEAYPESLSMITALIKDESCPDGALAFACRAHRDELLDFDEQGRLPLHLAIEQYYLHSNENSHSTTSLSSSASAASSKSLRWRMLVKQSMRRRRARAKASSKARRAEW